MKRLYLIIIVLLFNASFSFAQTLPANRSVDWTLAGLRDTFPMASAVHVDMQTQGIDPTGTMPNDAAISNVFATIFAPAVVLEFPSGTFLFNNSISLPDNVILKGQGADSTIFRMDLGGAGNAIIIQGTRAADTTAILETAAKDVNQLTVWDTTGFVAGDWIQTHQYDVDLVTSSWGINKTGQIVQIDSISNNIIWLKSPLRMTYDTARTPYISKLNTKKNVGIECLKIDRIDDTAPQQGVNIAFDYAVNCWVSGVESNNCTFSHVRGIYSSNLYINKSYFHHGFDYGGGGRAYGVVFQYATGECLVEDNVFERLRHSMLLQAGANGNAFTYNYSFDAFWTSNPSDASGDMVLHGNYVYANLFEQNICRNIVIDDSHGPNGPNNTFFRNRSEGFGIFFSATNSPDQNMIGNDIPNTGFPYSLANYFLQGAGHFVHGNNDKGTIKPTGTAALSDISYAYTTKPDFLPTNQWAAIGTPNVMGSASIPAKDRYTANNIFGTSCQGVITPIAKVYQAQEVVLYPNPTANILNIETADKIENLIISNELGQIIYSRTNVANYHTINTENWTQGIYFVSIQFENNKSITKKILKHE